MDYAIPNRAETDASARDRVARRGSTVSESTLRGEPSGIRTPNGERNANPLDPIAEPSTPQPLVHPIQIVTALLPPALQLLSQLGPLHLFSPPLVLPSLLESAGVSSAESAASMSDRASISSNTTSSSLHIIGTSSHIAHTYSHELHAPSTLSVPAVSAAAVWRLFRGFEWVGEMESGGSIIDAQRPPASAEDEIVAFDFPSALQGVADVLAAEAASKGVELVIGQVGSGSAPSPVTSPIDEASPGAEPDEAEDEKDTESRELLVRGDERAWSIVLVWVCNVCSRLPASTNPISDCRSFTISSRVLQLVPPSKYGSWRPPLIRLRRKAKPKPIHLLLTTKRKHSKRPCRRSGGTCRSRYCILSEVQPRPAHRPPPLRLRRSIRLSLMRSSRNLRSSSRTAPPISTLAPGFSVLKWPHHGQKRLQTIRQVRSDVDELAWTPVTDMSRA